MPGALKSPTLAQHWSRYGDVLNPTHKKIPVPDSYDDWLGIQRFFTAQGRWMRRVKLSAWHTFRLRGEKPIVSGDTLPFGLKFYDPIW